MLYFSGVSYQVKLINIIGNLLLDQYSKKHVPDLLIAAMEKYQQSYEKNTKNFQLLYNWGNALLYLATFSENSQPELAEKYLVQALDRFDIAMKLKTGDYKSRKNRAVVLSKLARLKKGI